MYYRIAEYNGEPEKKSIWWILIWLFHFVGLSENSFDLKVMEHNDIFYWLENIEGWSRFDG